MSARTPAASPASVTTADPTPPAARPPLPDATLDTLFRAARSHNGWLDGDVPDSALEELFEIMKWGPTSANGNHARIVFVRSLEAKRKLMRALSPGNVEKTMAAPVTAIIGYDTAFWQRLPELFPHKDMTHLFRDHPGHAEDAAFRNGSLQGAYLMIATRALGYDVGGMSGFDRAKVDELFFAGSTVRSNFLCNIGIGDPAKLWPRLPRLPFVEVCSVL